MNHFVPEFDTDNDDYVNVNNTNSLNLATTKPITGLDNDLMELLWENGQVVVQNQRLNKKPSPCSDQNLFIQEDEMTSWLHYPLREDDLCSDLLFSTSATATATAAATPAAPSTTAATQVTAPRPPAPTMEPRPPVRNFMNFSRLRGNFGRVESGARAIVRESTQVNPSTRQSSAASNSGLTRRTDEIESRGNGSLAVPLDRKGKAVADIPGTSTSKEPDKTIFIDERKRKEREIIDEQGRGQTTSNKRSRAAEVHNLSERKRRDRINERMKALQELIPRCNKSDKASMLDEAIDYMKSLQLQIQMMSAGCGMMPLMYPYMAMGMGMGMNQPHPPPFLPFPNMLPAQRPLPTSAASLFPGPHYPPHASDPSRPYLPNQQPRPTSTQPQFPAFTDPYHQFRNLHPTQQPQFQNQETSYPSSSRVSSSKESEDQGNHTTG